MWDTEKIKKVLSWVNETIDYKRIVESKSLVDVYMWIGAAYAVHSDTRSHTGGSISMRHVVLHEKALAQSLNTKISMEAELVGVSEYLPYNLWIMIFCMGRDM